jgi:NAD(P)-dependent dehydrogenase (short-subunit alcohol dehydrogenase family)
VSVSEEIIVSQLVGKTAVITGGSSGIGLSTAELFVSEGAYVYITGRRQKELDVAIAQIKHNITGVQGDVSQVEDLDRLYKRIAEEKGHIDVIFANAGIENPSAQIGQITEEQFHAIFDINVAGTLFTVQKARQQERMTYANFVAIEGFDRKGWRACVINGVERSRKDDLEPFWRAIRRRIRRSFSTR